MFHGKRHPADMGESEVTAFLTHLAEKAHVAASTQNQALCGLLFLYRHVLGRELGDLEGLVWAKRAMHIPVVLSRDEVVALLAQLRGTVRLIAVLLYGAGLRLTECLELRVKDLDFDRGQMTVRAGKGGRDRVVPLPLAAVDALHDHLEAVRRLHQRDLASGLGRVMLATAIEEKYPPLVCDTPAGGRIRHSYGAGASGPSRRAHDADLYARAESRAAGSPKSR